MALIPNRRIGAKRPGLNTIYSKGQGWSGHLSGEGPAPPPDPPTITNFVPTSGEVGASIVITGTGFDTANRVQFFNAVNAQFVIDSPTQITATVPVGAETGPINVRNPGGTAVSSGDFTVEVPVGAPVITSFIPTSGGQGEGVQINGTDFTGSTSVVVGGFDWPIFTVDSDIQITATVPIGALTGTIAVTNPQGTGVSADTFYAEHSVDSYTPNSGQENDPIQINGVNFTGASAVTFFNGINQPAFTVVNNTTITCNVPAGATDGAISVTTPFGTKSGPSFDVLPKAPVVNSYTPDNAAEGEGITINGTDFTEISAVTFFDGVDQPVFNVQSAIAITCNVPVGAATGAISVTNPGGTGVGPSFTVNPTLQVPVVDSFLPTSGPVGTEVVITGQNFAAASAVDFNGTNAPGFAIDSDTQITVNVPGGATTGPIGVTNAAGRGESAGSFTVDAAPAFPTPTGLVEFENMFSDGASTVPCLIDDGTWARVLEFTGPDGEAMDYRHSTADRGYERSSTTGLGADVLDQQLATGGAGTPVTRGTANVIAPDNVTIAYAMTVQETPVSSAVLMSWDGLANSRVGVSMHDGTARAVRFRAFSSSEVIVTYPTGGPTNMHLLIIRMTRGGTWEIWANGGVALSGSAGTDVWDNVLPAIHRFEPGNDYRLGHFYMWNRRLSDAECNGVEAHYQALYNMAGGTPT